MECVRGREDVNEQEDSDRWPGRRGREWLWLGRHSGTGPRGGGGAAPAPVRCSLGRRAARKASVEAAVMRETRGSGQVRREMRMWGHWWD